MHTKGSDVSKAVNCYGLWPSVFSKKKKSSNLLNCRSIIKCQRIYLRHTDGQKSHQWAAMCFLALAAHMSMLSEYVLLKKDAIIVRK